MKQLSYKTINDFIKNVDLQYTSFSNSNSNTNDKDEEDIEISIVAKYKEAKQILEELVKAGYKLFNIDLEDGFCGYNDEFIITITNIYEDRELWCERAFREYNDGYISFDGYFVYVLDNCNSKILKYITSSIVFEVSIDKTDSCCSCNKCDNNLKLVCEKKFDDDTNNENEEFNYDELLNKFINRCNKMLDFLEEILFYKE